MICVDYCDFFLPDQGVSSESWTWVEVTEKTQVFDCFLWLIPNSFKMSFNIRLLWLPIRTFLHVHVYDVTLCNENLFHYEELVKGVTMYDQTASLTWNVMICNNKQPFEPSIPLSDILVETYRLQNCSADLSRSININVQFLIIQNDFVVKVFWQKFKKPHISVIT